VVQARAPPDVLVALDDEGRERLLGLSLAGDLERIGVDLEEAVLALLEDEGEGRERLGRAQPGELAPAPVDRGLEVLGVPLAHEAVDAVGGQDQVRARELGGVLDLALELQAHAELAAARVEDLQQALARQTAEAVARRAHTGAAVEGLDVGPGREALLDGREALRVRLLEAAQRLVGEDHAPAEGVVGAVALVDRDLGLRERLAHQDAEIEPGRAPADRGDLHRAQDKE
jgi:hypothetical protein